MIQFAKQSGQRIIELGCGQNRHSQADVAVDVRHIPGVVDFTADFNNPFPIGSEEFDGIYSAFCLEHVSYRSVPQFVRECLRILKPGGKALLIVPNTEEQLKWVQSHPEGWDNKSLFEAASEKLFGSQNMPDDQGVDHNTHRCYFSPEIVQQLFQEAGFRDIVTQPYGERQTDLVIQAMKPMNTNVIGTNVQTLPANLADVLESTPTLADAQGDTTPAQPLLNAANAVPARPKPEELFDKEYFGGGRKVGGYLNEGYWDFACHQVTTRHVLSRKPESVLEIGAGRGYVLKRIQDAGVVAAGMDVSKHAVMTRVCEAIKLWNVCDVPWVVPDHHNQVRTDLEYDLCFSIAVLDHIPEEDLPTVMGGMKRTCKRGLHGIDFNPDTRADRTRCTIHPKEWWIEQFAKHAPGWPVEVCDKNELENAPDPDWSCGWMNGDGKVKLNLGSFTTMFHNGWVNTDIHDLGNWATNFGYHFKQCDLRGPLPFATGGVDLIYAHHVVEHLSYDEGQRLLMECRRVLKRNGAMRIVVPNASFLTELYTNPGQEAFEQLCSFDEINEGCAKAKTVAGKLHAMLMQGHSSIYDSETLCEMLKTAHFTPHRSHFRKRSDHPALQQIGRECLEMEYGGLSLFVNATIG